MSCVIDSNRSHVCFDAVALYVHPVVLHQLMHPVSFTVFVQ